MIKRYINIIFISLLIGVVLGLFAYWIASLTLPWLTERQLKVIIPGFIMMSFSIGIIEAIRSYTLTTKKTLAVYAESNRVFMCYTSRSDKITCSSNTIGIDPSISFEKQLITVLTPARKQLKGWLPIRLILSLPCDSPTLSSDILHKAASRLRCNLYVFDFRLCCSMGIGLDTSAFSKQRIVIVAKDAIHVFIIFADGIFYETCKTIAPYASMSKAIEDAILDLDGSISTDLPSQFQRKMFSSEEYNRILTCWRSPSNDNVHVIFTTKKRNQDTVSATHYKVVTHDNFDEIIKAGLSKITTIFNHDKSLL
ncbi:MAG: hypothetical protein ACYC7L_15615 [Nitrospirota bacterium]